MGPITPAAGVYAAPNSTGAFATGDPVYPYDAYEPWVHGYWQEIPAYGGYTYFRPYNYKHVLSQAQVAGGWGMSPVMPYSHEYFRKMQEQAAAERQLTQVRATAYAAELARLRAQKDFDRQPELTVPGGGETLTAARPPENLSRYSTTVVRGVSEPNAPSGVDPAVYTRLSRIEELNQRVERQSQELRVLQQALQEEYSRSTAPSDARLIKGR
jgi:hypothetical protein